MEAALIIKVKDTEELSLKAASIFKEISDAAVNSKGRFSVCLSGGHTPRRLYGILSSDAYIDNIDWKRTEFFFGDERSVKPYSGTSNFRTAYECLLKHLPVDIKNIHRIKGELPADKAALDYEKEIGNFFGLPSGIPSFDLILLGMGEDGHTASLFPGSDSLSEKARLAVPIFDVKPSRVSISLPLINNASNVLFLASGGEKASVIGEVLSGGEKAGRYPAGMVSPLRGTLRWIIDEAAGGMVDRN